jgi:protein-S-isoprenylcysteine O-methyltransferase Ste14
MYLGHLIFLGALVLTTRSPVAAAALTALVPWFDDRAAHDERRLTERFGAEYTAYRDRVPRWLPRP